MAESSSRSVLRKKKLMYISINSEQDKLRTLYKYILPGRRCIVICQDGSGAQQVTNGLNQLNEEDQGKDGPIAFMVEGSSAVPTEFQCLVVSATGAALTEEEATDFDTFVMHDDPGSKEQYKNWVWHSYCSNIISFLVNEPEELNFRQNYLFDLLETSYGVTVEEFKPGSKRSGTKEKSRDKEEKRSKHRSKDDSVARLEEKHKEEIDKLTQLIQQLLTHQQVQVEQHQMQQKEQKDELEQQIRSLQTLLAQQQEYLERQRMLFEAQMQGKMSDLASEQQAGQKELESRMKTMNLNTMQQLLTGVQSMGSGRPGVPLPTFQQYASADPTHQARMLQQLQQYAQKMQAEQLMAQQQAGMYAAQQVYQQYAQRLANQPTAAYQAAPSLPQPLKSPDTHDTQGPRQHGNRFAGKGRQSGVHHNQPRWQAAQSNSPSQARQQNPFIQAPQTNSFIQAPQNNPFSQAQIPAASSASVQQLASMDQELELLKAKLAQKQGVAQALPGGPPPRQVHKDVPTGGVWVPGKGYSGVLDGRMDARGGRGQGGGPQGHDGHHRGSYPENMADPDAPLPSDWRTSERWDDNATSY